MIAAERNASRLGVTAPRGFTLIEALVATALLAIVAAACMPLLRAAAEGSDLSNASKQDGTASSPIAPLDRSLVERLADRIAQKPSAFGIDGTTAGIVTASWPEDLRSEASDVRDWPSVEIEVLLPDGDGDANETVSRVANEDRWIEVRSGTVSITRWCTVPGRTRSRGSGRQVRRRRGATRVVGTKTGLAFDRRVPTAARTSARGMTLIETLVTIAITSALATAVFAWTSTAARVANEVSARASRDATAEAVLRAIADDLLCRDIDPNARGAGRRPVIADGTALTIRTRAGSGSGAGSGTGDLPGPVVRTYALNASTGELRVTDKRPDGGTGDSVLARDVSSWSARLGEKGEWLDVEIAIGSRTPLSRRFTVP